jgi:hypothetical protein
MSKKLVILGAAAAVTALSGYLAVSTAANDSHDRDNGVRNVQVGPRPYFLVDDMDPSPLKTALQAVQRKANQEDRFLHRPSWRRAAIPRAHQGVLRSRRTHGRGHRRV